MLKGALTIYGKKESQGATEPRQHPKDIELLIQFLTATSIEYRIHINRVGEDLGKVISHSAPTMK